MARNTQFNARDLTGKNLYHIKNQTIYYDSLTKKGYIVTNSNVKDFTSWQMRLPLIIIVVCVLILLKVNPLIALAIGIVIYAVAEYLFRKQFLANLPVSTSFKKPASLGFFKDIAARYTSTTLKIMGIMFFVMAVTMFITSFVIGKYEGSAATVSWVFIAIAVVAGCLMFYILSVKNKNNL